MFSNVASSDEAGADALTESSESHKLVFSRLELTLLESLTLRSDKFWRASTRSDSTGGIEESDSDGWIPKNEVTASHEDRKREGSLAFSAGFVGSGSEGSLFAFVASDFFAAGVIEGVPSKFAKLFQ